MHGQTYKVQHTPHPKGSNKQEIADFIGLSSSHKGLCWISNDKNYSEAAQEQTFYHELTHLILNHLNERKLNRDEKFVDGFAGLLHQFMKSRKY